jgi:hypothetical protein
MKFEVSAAGRVPVPLAPKGVRSFPLLSCRSGGYNMKEKGEYYKLHYSRVSGITKTAKDKT